MHIEQTSEQDKANDSLWKWSLWLEGEDAELDNVARVVYHLHPSFPNPIVERSDRANKFRLDASGWGTFVVRIDIFHKDGGVENKRHRLRFVRHEPRIFVSAASSDQEAVDGIRALAGGLGIEVSCAADVPPGEDLSSTIQSAIDSSKAVVVVSGSNPSRWVMQEVNMAKSLGKPMFVVGDSDHYSLKSARTVATVGELKKHFSKL